MNMVAALLKKSEPTIVKAVFIDPENLRDVAKVTEPAINRQQKDLTADLAVVSLTLRRVASRELRAKRARKRVGRHIYDTVAILAQTHLS